MKFPPLWFFGRPIYDNKSGRGFVTRICKKRKETTRNKSLQVVERVLF